MKNVFYFGCILFSVSLMSFVAKTNVNQGVIRLGEELYSVETEDALSKQDGEIIAEYVAKEYNLGDWRAISEDITLAAKPKPGKCANSILDEKVRPNFVKKKLMRYDCASGTATPDEEAILRILARYAK